MEEKTQLLTDKKPAEQAKVVLSAATKSSKLKNFAKPLGTVVLGVAAGGLGVFALMGMTPPTPVNETGNPVDLNKPEIPDEPKQATEVDDDLSYADAFKSARQEVGATGFFEWHGKVYGTMYESEQSQLSPDEKKELYNNIMSEYKDNLGGNDIPETAIVIHDVAPVADGVSDDMSFKDAFAVARSEVGPGGVFEWHGQTFNTYTNDEFGTMNDEQKQEFIASVGNDEVEPSNINGSDVDIVKLDGSEEDISSLSPQSDTVSENMIAEDYIIDPETGEKYHVAMFEVNGEQVLKIDADNDGTFDTILTQDENGNVHVTTADGQSDVISQDDVLVLQDDTQSINQEHTFASSDEVDLYDTTDYNHSSHDANIHDHSTHNNPSLGSDFDNNANTGMV